MTNPETLPDLRVDRNIIYLPDLGTEFQRSSSVLHHPTDLVISHIDRQQARRNLQHAPNSLQFSDLVALQVYQGELGSLKGYLTDAVVSGREDSYIVAVSEGQGSEVVIVEQKHLQQGRTVHEKVELVGAQILLQEHHTRNYRLGISIELKSTVQIRLAARFKYLSCASRSLAYGDWSIFSMQLNDMSSHSSQTYYYSSCSSDLTSFSAFKSLKKLQLASTFDTCNLVRSIYRVRFRSLWLRSSTLYSSSSSYSELDAAEPVPILTRERSSLSLSIRFLLQLQCLAMDGSKQQAKQESRAFAQLQSHYEQQVQPIELIVQAISLQNEHLSKLTQRYTALKEKQAKLLAEIPQKDDEDRSPVVQHAEQMRKERNSFMEEALQSKKEAFEQAYRSRKREKLEEIYMKWEELALYGVGTRSTNLFAGLQDETLLPQLIDHFDHLPGQEDAVQRLRIWKDLAKRGKSDSE